MKTGKPILAAVRWTLRDALAAPIAGLFAALAVLGATASPARAAEGPGDVETDHLDAFDDGGPPSFGVLVNPLGALVGTFAAEGDFALGHAAALSAEGNWTSVG